MGNFVCSCLQVTEEDVIHAIVSHGLRDLREVRQHTGAGDGCMACRRRLQHYLEEYAGNHVYRERITAVALEVVGCG